MSELVVTVLAKEPINDAHISISYFVRDAGWTPTYDFKIEKLSQPMRLVYKANVYQYSGEDWKEVKLALSTGNPFKSGIAPVLRTWVLGQKNDYSEYYNTINQEDNFDVVNENTSQVRGLVTARGDRTGIPGVSVMIKGTTLRTATDPNGNYRLTIPPTLFGKRVTLIFSMIGFKSLEKNVSSNLVDVILEEDARSLSEVVVVGNGLQGRVAGLEVSGDKETAKRTIPLDISEKEAPT
ncbi:DUF4139 domain-containing protein, partial [Massilia pinisoli]|uniref:DUF4139 domain-containing protein n=1 Tax=Massilia pinisoli TaxID=1772194 RepID=UPI00362DD79A